MCNTQYTLVSDTGVVVFYVKSDSVKFKVALDPCYNYICIYFKSMHELRRLKTTTIEIFMRIYFLKFFS